MSVCDNNENIINARSHVAEVRLTTHGMAPANQRPAPELRFPSASYT